MGDALARFLGDRALMVFDQHARLTWLSPRAREELGHDFAPSRGIVGELREVAARPHVASHVLRARVDGRRVVVNVMQDRAVPIVIGELIAADKLSPAETRVFDALGRGLGNAEIAAHLHLSVATVKTHLHRIFDKLGIRTRVEAVIIAQGRSM